MIYLGQVRRRRPEINRGRMPGRDYMLETGVVVYIHPQWRYYVLEYAGVKGSFREAFHLPPRLAARLRREAASGRRGVLP